MARPDGRIEKGQRLSTAISARAWNRAQEAADRVLGAQPGTEGAGLTSATPAPNVVLIKNTSGVDVPMCGVLKITGVEINPSGGTLDGQGDADRWARQFVAQPILTGSMPGRGDENLAIALEPIANDKIGRAAVGGAFACKVRINSALHNFATSKDGDLSQLDSVACGPIQLLWKEGLTGPLKWAVGIM